MTTELRRAAEMALEALELPVYTSARANAVSALRAALALEAVRPSFECPRCGHCCPHTKTEQSE